MATTITFKHVKHSIRGCDAAHLAVKRVGYIMSNGPGEDKREQVLRAGSPFIYDPPRYLDEEVMYKMNINKQGITFWQNPQGIWDIFDWIGEKYYPNAADIIEESLFKDGSALVKITHDLELLTPGVSKRYFLVPNGVVLNPDVLLDNREIVPSIPECFLAEGERDWHQQTREYCASLHWENVCFGAEPSGNARLTTRKVGDWEYPCAKPPKGYVPDFGAAVVMWMYCDWFREVIGNPDENPQYVNDEIQKTLELIGGMNMQLPIFATDN